MTTTAADLLASQLRELGVDRLFTLNGGHIAPIYEACLDHGPAIVDVRHEDAAVQMANAYSRLTGKPGVVCLTAGPGVTNGATGIAAAWASASPVVVIGGKVPLPQADLGGLQDVDQVSILRPITRTARTVLEPGRIGEYVAEAYRQAALPPHAPTFVEIPTDVLRTPVTSDETLLFPGVDEVVPGPDPAAIRNAGAALREAQRPVIVAGSGVLWSNAEDDLRRLAEILSAPVLTTSLARGILPSGHALNLYAARSHLLSNADVILVIGTRFNFILNYGRPPRLPARAAIIHIDASPDEVHRNRRADIAVVSDARSAIQQLIDVVAPIALTDREWLGEANSIHSSTTQQVIETSGSGRIHPLQLCNEVKKASPSNTRFVIDGGDILSFARLAIQPDGPRQFLDPGPFGSLGVGVPFSNATKLAAPDDPVVCVTGDGALGMNVMELDTSVRHGLPIVVVVSNNSAWGIERNAQIADFGRDRVVATELRDVRFDRLAEALGCRGRRVHELAEVGPAVREGLASGEPTVIDVVVDVDAVSPDLRRGLATVPDRSPVAWTERGMT